MTHHEITVLEDGTRVYSNGTRYKPKSSDERKYKVRKIEGAVRFRGVWFLPLELTDPAARVMPETRPDSDAYDHMVKGRKCSCRVCQRPVAVEWQNKWRRDRGLL